MKREMGWYNWNENRAFPLDDVAKLVDDNGQRLPHDLLADLYLLFPETAGDRAFLGSLTVSPQIVTATFLAVASEFVPLATVSVRRPIIAGRQYALESQSAGAGGWVVFGSGVNEASTRSYRFSTPSQSILLLQAARRYRPTPVRSLGKVAVEPALTGIVQLSGGDDLEIVKEEREIGGVVRDVAVFRLKDKTEAGTRNLLDVYKGVCNARPESGNCGEPEPIEFLNSVVPDCCGRIWIEFRGCAELSSIQNDDCGVQISCGFLLDDACVSPNRLPDETGRLPNTFEDNCLSLSEDVP